MTKSVKLLLLSGLAAIASWSCSNSFDWVAKVSDEVMLANDMYLRVTGVTPINNEGDFSPEDPIRIQFDREVDLGSVTAASIVFSPAATWAPPSFAAGTLTIDPDSLNAKKDYTVTVGSGVKGRDGSALRAPYTWTFTTTDTPSGTIKISDISTNSETYTNDTLVRLSVEASDVVTEMRFSSTAFLKTDSSVVWQDLAPTADYDMLGNVGDDGLRTVYYQFRDAGDHRTEVKLATITQDMTAPAVALSNPPTWINQSGWTSNASASDGGSGIVAYAWSTYSGTAVTFSPQNQLNTLVTGITEGTTQIRLTVTDLAENPGTYTSPTITVDLTAPTKPTVTAEQNPTTDTTPRFFWTSGGGGSGYYRYKWASGSWSSETTAGYASASPAIGTYGETPYMYVVERDAAGNWSEQGQAYTFLYPSYLVPYHLSTGVSRWPTLTWGTSVVAGVTYTVYIQRYPLEPFLTALVENTTAISYTYSTGGLAADMDYHWFYTRTESGQTVSIPAGSKKFRFRTAP